jgi:hypothetical protein
MTAMLLAQPHQACLQFGYMHNQSAATILRAHSSNIALMHDSGCSSIPEEMKYMQHVSCAALSSVSTFTGCLRRSTDSVAMHVLTQLIG